MIFAYSVWTWNSDTGWESQLGTNEFSKGSQVVRALQNRGYNSDSQFAGLYGSYDIAAVVLIEAVWQGRTYNYGYCPDLSTAYRVVDALSGFFIPGVGVNATDLSTGHRYRDPRNLADAVFSNRGYG